MSPRHIPILATVVVVCLCVIPPMTQGQLPALALQGLGSGPYARMEADVEATIFSIDVLHVSIRYDGETERRLAALCHGQPFSSERVPHIARVAAGAERVAALVRFKRRVSYRTYIERANGNLDSARSAGLITADNHARAKAALPDAYSELRSRGFQDGDEIVYQASGDVMHTAVRDRHGVLLTERVQRGSTEPRAALLGSFFAPSSLLREPLVASLFQ